MEEATADRFARFCERAAAHLGDLMSWACTLNEPNIVALMGHLAGVFPPGVRDVGLRRKANEVLIEAHVKGAAAIRSGPGNAPVGMTLSMTDYQAEEGAEPRRDRIRRSMEDIYLEAARGDDFFGVQCYSRSRVGKTGALNPEPGVELTQMGYEFWPQCVEASIRRAWEVSEGVPLLVTENGIGTSDDERRVAYVTEALKGVRACLDDGIDVRGYTYWSAMDNFEWALGYAPTFGLIEVDRHTFERRPKQSAGWLGSVARSNRLATA